MTRPLLCWIGAGLCLVLGFGALMARPSLESACKATDASGRSVVIGTEFNEAGRRYHRENPTENNDDILAAFALHGPEAAWTRESIASCNRKLAIAGIVPTVAFPLGTAFFAALAFLVRARANLPALPKPGTVFLSYTHTDAATAGRLRSALQARSITVLIDADSMHPGERIHDFIERGIRASDVVVSIVSSQSLLSAWVALETVQTLHRNRWIEGRRFIPCYLDDGFFAPECRLNLTSQIDERLRVLEGLVAEHATRRIDTRDLDQEKSRLYDLRNNLGLILDTLKGALCLDLRDFDATVDRLASTIRPH